MRSPHIQMQDFKSFSQRCLRKELDPVNIELTAPGGGGQGKAPFWLAVCNSEQWGFLQETLMGLAGHQIPWMPLCARRNCVYTFLVKQDCWGLESFQLARKLGIRSFLKQGGLVTINNSRKGLATEELKKGNGRLGIGGLDVGDFSQPEQLLWSGSSHPDTLQECHCDGLWCFLSQTHSLWVFWSVAEARDYLYPNRDSRLLETITSWSLLPY